MSAHPRSTRALHIVVLAATILIGLSSTMLAICMPRASADLHAGAVAATWMLLSYQVVCGGLLVLGGQLADRYDARSLFRTGMAAFTTSSVGLVLAANPSVFIAARAVQGVGAALLLSTCVVLLSAAHRPGPARTTAISLYLAGFAIAQVVGPLVGGIVTQTAGWRWLFAGTTLLGVLALGGGWRAIGSVPVDRPGPGAGLGVDVPGNLVIAAALTLSMVGVSGAQERGWTDPLTVALLVGSVMLMPLLVTVERRARRPAIAIQLMRDRPFALACLGSFLLSGPRLAPAVVLSLFVQGYLGAGPIDAALTISPLPVAVTIGTLAAGRFVGRNSIRFTAWAAGLSAVGAAVLVLAVVLDGQRIPVMTGLAILGLGTGVYQTLNAATILGLSPAGAAGTVNGVRVLTQQGGVALAMAVLVSLSASRLSRTEAPDYFAGAASRMSPAAHAAIRDGHLIAMSVLVLVCLAALWSTIALGRRLRGAHETGS